MLFLAAVNLPHYVVKKTQLSQKICHQLNKTLQTLLLHASHLEWNGNEEIQYLCVFAVKRIRSSLMNREIAVNKEIEDE